MPKITEIRCGQFASSKIESTTQLSHGRVVIYHTDKNYHMEKKNDHMATTRDSCDSFQKLGAGWRDILFQFSVW